MWTLSLEKGATFDLSAFGNCASIRSVCLSSDATRILVGTKGCEIYEVSEQALMKTSILAMKCAKWLQT